MCQIPKIQCEEDRKTGKRRLDEIIRLFLVPVALAFLAIVAIVGMLLSWK